MASDKSLHLGTLLTQAPLVVCPRFHQAQRILSSGSNEGALAIERVIIIPVRLVLDEACLQTIEDSLQLYAALLRCGGPMQSTV